RTSSPATSARRAGSPVCGGPRSCSARCGSHSPRARADPAAPTTPAAAGAWRRSSSPACHWTAPTPSAWSGTAPPLCPLWTGLVRRDRAATTRMPAASGAAPSPSPSDAAARRHTPVTRTRWPGSAECRHSQTPPSPLWTWLGTKPWPAGSRPARSGIPVHPGISGREHAMGRVEGKVAFVTGAARGQGRSHAIRLAEEGADIIAVDVPGDYDTVGYPMGTEQELAETVKAVEALDRRIVASKADVRDLAALKSALDDGV